ncbi:uncharacterized protein LOC111454950 [Cucurbita moschata]|uniref:Uncharacterized protein LOC111454950 n=1 Tax=Cucurbita moschata TaxID=3662 RepID=A0A6J1GJL5_CUCMO|nr:uncharacterized protein LOC111454950 [Cucurbita moschata]XP_022952207.1 uncharacterized protein LOC111454950 [Cucurbita moschata]
MVRFSCFHAHVHNHKLKKTGQLSAEAMHKSLEDLSRSKVPKDSPRSTGPDQLLIKTENAKQDTNRADHMASIIENSRLASETTDGLKKSRSIGSMPYGDGSAAVDNDSEDGREFSCNSSQFKLEISDSGKAQGLSMSDRFKDVVAPDSLCASSGPVITKEIFLTDDPARRETEGDENAGSSLFGDGDTGSHTPGTTQMIVKSCSMPNFDASSPVSGGSPSNDFLPPSRSSEDLQLLDPQHGEMSLHEMEMPVNGCESGEDIVDENQETEKIDYENFLDDGNDSCHDVMRDWRTSVVDEVNPRETLDEESVVQHFIELPGNDFKFKRIEEWVSDLQLCSPPVETTEVYESDANEVKRDSSIETGSSAGRIDSKATAGMEAAKRYISSMSAAASTAQLANHGLVVIPLLSAFVSLKVLNLSANSIGKITAGALPRGLHSLNLSRNNISTIEGLRELTRLRVLDLSYNRISRIGHGLASCSSLKELYLAGNKISEVEGLHRLLKLCILDLCFNKISTTKSLGQLAANYNSLQAISLGGNPAQKNVGDDQLKKHLQGLLPHLVYYNRRPTKGSTLKDGADRSVRLGISGHQFEHGSRLDHKGTRKTTHSHRGQGLVLPRRSKLRQGHAPALPPCGSKVDGSSRYHHHFDISNRQLEYKSNSRMRRSRSEGTLAHF